LNSSRSALVTKLALIGLAAVGPLLAQIPTRPERSTPRKPVQREAEMQSRANRPKGRQTHTPPEALEVILENGKRTKIDLAWITKAATGVILRGQKEKQFTPLAVVMDAAGIPKNSKILVKGTGPAKARELLLQVNAAPLMDPNDYGFIFNSSGFAHLAHKPGLADPDATPGKRWPEVKEVASIEIVPTTPGK
jgi:hypothetical protein